MFFVKNIPLLGSDVLQSIYILKQLATGTKCVHIYLRPVGCSKFAESRDNHDPFEPCKDKPPDAIIPSDEYVPTARCSYTNILYLQTRKFGNVCLGLNSRQLQYSWHCGMDE